MTRDTKNILAFGLVLWLAAGLVVSVAINFGGNAEPYDGYIAAGDNAYEISEFAEAAQHFRAAVAEAEKLGADTSQLSYALNGLGMTLRAQGQYAAALEIFRRNVLIKEGSLGPDHPELATSLSNAADSLQLRRSRASIFARAGNSRSRVSAG